MSDSQFKKALDKNRLLYRSFEPVFSPVIQTKVHFSAPGFNHLRFKIDNTPRTPAEAVYKLKLLKFVPTVVTEAKSVDEYVRRVSPVGGTRKKIYKEMEYWSLVYNIPENNFKIRVILRKVAGSNQVCFWSVMKLDSHTGSKKPHLIDEAV